MSREFVGYITKYAMSGGVHVANVEVLRTDESYAREGKFSLALLKIGRDVFEDRASAVEDFDKRKAKKIASLAKQIKKIEKMEFCA